MQYYGFTEGNMAQKPVRKDQLSFSGKILINTNRGSRNSAFTCKQ